MVNVPGIRPRRRAVRLVSAGAALAVVAALGLASRLPGGASMTSPGPVAAAHSTIETRCVACHVPRQEVAADRCARCHDASTAMRLLPAAHARTLDPARARTASEPGCATCHVDHLGRPGALTRVDNRTCATCHAFRDVAAHPPLRAAHHLPAVGDGLQFTHARHLRWTAPAGCGACHVPDATGTGFEPVGFDAHCASCHLERGFLPGTSDPVVRDALLPVPDGAGAPGLHAFDADQVTITGLRHRDEWALANLLRWRKASDPDGIRDEALAMALRQQDAAARQIDTPRLDAPDLHAERQRLLAVRLAMDARTMGTRWTGVRLTALVPWLTRLARAVPGDSAAAEALRHAESDSLSPALFARMDELLAHTAGRASHDGGLPRLVAESRARLRDLAEQSANRDAMVRLRARVRMEDVLQAAGRHADPVIRQRASALAERLDQELVFEGDAPERRARLSRALDRVSLEARLREAGVPAPAHAGLRTGPAVTPADDDRLRRLVEGYFSDTGDLAPHTASDAAASLVRVCATCHEFEGARLLPVSAPRRRLANAVFRHLPHLRQATCESCHADVAASNESATPHLPDFSLCQSCHRQAQAPVSCVTCHTYHPSSFAHTLRPSAAMRSR